VQLEPQRRVPAVPQVVVQVAVVPRQHAKPSSHVVSQSSSVPLQTSAGGLHVPHAHDAEQVREPVVPQLAVHEPVDPCAHAKPSSTKVSQSSSTALQVSAGGEHGPQPQLDVHVREPVVPQLERQADVDAGAQVKSSSMRVSQSSSVPLQSSAGGAHAPHAQVPLQTREPVVPQLVVHEPVEPIAQANASSVRVSQSSSLALQASTGGAQVPHAHELEHTREPVEPQAVVHDPVEPRQHAKPSSHALLQSSSMPLQASGGGEQTPQLHTALHTRAPVVPQLVMHEPDAPRQHANPSSHVVSQSSSMPLQSSGAPGKTVAIDSSQSSAGTPPTGGHVGEPCPSRSASRVVATHMPGIVPTHA
jgi:hypothetical protein